MFDIPTIIEAPSEGVTDSSSAESSTATSPEANASPPSGETQTTQASATEQSATEQAAGDNAATPEGDQTQQAQPQPETDQQPDRLDKHPRFRQVVTERRQFKDALESERLAKAQLEGRLQALESAMQQRPTQQSATRDFNAELAAIDAKLDAGEISATQARALERALNSEALQTQQAAFQAQLNAQLAAGQQAFDDKAKEAAKQAQVDALQSRFVQENPDFVTFRESGELDNLRSENPLHDYVSAYYALKAQQAEASKKDAVEAAVKAAEDRVRKEFAAKQSAKTLQGSTSAPPAAGSAVAPELANPKKYGGVSAVLARRLEQRMASAHQ